MSPAAAVVAPYSRRGLTSRVRSGETTTMTRHANRPRRQRRKGRRTPPNVGWYR